MTTSDITKHEDTTFSFHNERSRRVRTICDKYQEILSWRQGDLHKNLRNHIWDFTHSLVYCPVAKVASSTWFLNFANMLRVNRTGLQKLKQSHVAFAEEIPYVKKNMKNKITKIKIRNIVNNITTLNNQWHIKDIQKV